MIINGYALLSAAPIKSMLGRKEHHKGVSHGLAEVGYDIRIKQTVKFEPGIINGGPGVRRAVPGHDVPFKPGRFLLASTVEEFQMPTDLMGVVHDKSTWARQGVSVFNTVIEPGWRGFLTLELVFHGNEPVVIPANCGVAQVIFHKTECFASYSGKYQDQVDMPVPAILS